MVGWLVGKLVAGVVADCAATAAVAACVCVCVCARARVVTPRPGNQDTRAAWNASEGPTRLTSSHREFPYLLHCLSRDGDDDDDDDDATAATAGGNNDGRTTGQARRTRENIIKTPPDVLSFNVTVVRTYGCMYVGTTVVVHRHVHLLLSLIHI